MSSHARITLGPIASSAARSFVSFARPEIRRLSEDPVLSLTFTPQMTASFEAILDTWADVATTDPFEWTAELPTDHAEYLLYALFLAVEHRRAELGGAPQGADVGARRPFVVHLIARFHEALAATPDADHARLDHLNERWPADLRT